MSAIAGIVNFSGQSVAPQQLHAMTAALAHRGPDGINHWVAGPVALAQCMMHTTAESLTEVQPLISTRSGCVMVMDGRLNNWEELRKELEAPHANDADLAMLAYERWGADFPGHLDGAFAIALWDPHEQTLHCARDIFGLRPFYYCWDGQRLAFSSEIRPLRELPWVTAKLNEGMVAEWLAFEWYSRVETFWQAIYRIEPSCRLVVDANGVRHFKHWQPDLFKPLHYSNDAGYVEHYRDLLEDSVRRVCRSHLPIAFEVSGGLDSSAIYALAVSLQSQGRLPAPDVRGYTMAFPPGTDADELAFARAVARHTRTRIEECVPTQQPLSWYLQRALDRSDVPDIPNGAMFLGLRESARRGGARLCINGMGGDEFTGVGTGGMYYADLLSAGEWRGLLQAFARDIPSLGPLTVFWWFSRYGAAVLLPERFKRLTRRLRGVRPANPWWLSSSLQELLSARRRPDPRQDGIKVARYSQRMLMHFFQHPGLDHSIDMLEYHAASIGMEIHSPYYNKQILEFALSTGEWTRQRGMQHRWLHRQAMKGLLPSEILQRRGKAEFSQTLLNNLQELRGDHLRSTLVRRQHWLNDESAAKIQARSALDQPCVLEWVTWYLACCDGFAG